MVLVCCVALVGCGSKKVNVSDIIEKQLEEKKQMDEMVLDGWLKDEELREERREEQAKDTSLNELIKPKPIRDIDYWD